MNIAYCVKCKSKNEFNNGTIKTNKRGIRYLSGNCVSCNTKVNKFIKNDSKLEPIGEELKVESNVEKNENVGDVEADSKNIKSTAKKKVITNSK